MVDDGLSAPAPKKPKKELGKGKKQDNLVEGIEAEELKESGEDVYKTYVSPFGTLEVLQIDSQTQGVYPLWSLLQPEINAIRRELSESIFGSPLLSYELAALDLKSNSEIFPVLVNQEGDLRERAQKISQKPSDLRKWQSLAKHLDQRSQAFKDIELGAQKQAKSYQQMADSVRSSKKISAVLDINVTDSNLKMILEANTNLTAQAWISLSDSLSDHLTCIAERYRQELTPLLVYIRRAIDTLHQREATLASLIFYAREAIETPSPLSYFFPGFIQFLQPGTHLCQCSTCLPEGPHPAIPATSATPPVPTSPHANPTNSINQIRYIKSDFSLPMESVQKLSLADENANLTPTMILDLEFCYKQPVLYGINEAFSSLHVHQEYVRSEIRAIEEDYLQGSKMELLRLQEENEKHMTKAPFEAYIPTPQDIAEAENAKAQCIQCFQSIQEEWLEVTKSPYPPFTPEETRRIMEYKHQKMMIALEEDTLNDWYKAETDRMDKYTPDQPFALVPLPLGSYRYLESTEGVAPGIKDRIRVIQGRLATMGINYEAYTWA